MDLSDALLGLVAGFLISVVTTPVGVSGAVFLLPVQLSVLAVPNPQVTPTNLLFNVVAGPGGLLRYWRQGSLDRRLAVLLVAGSAPGVVLGAALRVHVVPGQDAFRIVAAAVLGAVGAWILLRPRRAGAVRSRTWTTRGTVALAFAVGTVGGIYGIGGGSILGPLLVGSGMAVSGVAAAALASTWVTSVIGVLAYAVLAVGQPGTIAPDWTLGIACGLGGLLGGWVGASLQPQLPEPALRVGLGTVALGLALAYAVQAAL